MKIWRSTLMLTILGVGLTGAIRAGSSGPDSQIAQFRRACSTAMDHMMDAMGEPTTGDVDKDFVQMMKPHHQAAIDMAQSELRYGHNEQLRRIAQEIIVDQQQELLAMDMAIGKRPAANADERSASVKSALTEESK